MQGRKLKPRDSLIPAQSCPVMDSGRRNQHGYVCFRLIYQEVTGSSDTTTIEPLAEELSRMETGPQTISRMRTK